MPALSPADAALSRSSPPIVKYYLAIVPRRVVFACVLDNATATYGETVLPYDGVTMGLWGDVVVGQTLWIYTSGAVYKAKVRVRAIDADEITVAANYDIEWEDDDLLRVMGIFEPWSVPTGVEDPNGDLIYYKDTDIAWVDNDTAFPPKANDQGAWAGFLGSNGWVDVQFDAVDSVANTDGGSVVSWNRPSAGGAFSSGGVATEQATIRFSTGAFRWVTLTVTDNNGQTGVHRMPVWTFGGNYQPFTNFEIVRRTKEVRDGELTIEAYDGSITLNDIPEGTRLVLFTVTEIDGTEVISQMGCPFLGRAHVKFDGYVLKDSVVWDAETGTVTFSVGTLGKIADDMRGFATFIKDVDAGEEDSWHTGSVLTVRNVIFWLLRWHTNLTELAYMEIEPTELIAGRKFPKAPPFKQLEAAMLMTRGVFARLGVSRWHSVHIRYDPQELSVADRATRATVLNLTNFDWLTELNIEKAARPRIASVFGGGIVYDGADGTPYRARAPGPVGRESGRDTRADNLIISSQNNLNALLGRLLAAESSPWKPPSIELLYDVWEPALQEYLTLVVSADENPRGFSFTADEPWIVRRVEIEDVQGGTPSVKVTPELLMGEFVGITVPVPDPPEPGDWPEPPPPPPIPPVIPPDVATWPGKVYVATLESGVFYTESFGGLEDAAPIWVEVDDTGLLNLNLRKFQVDVEEPDRYQYVQLDSTDRDKIYRRKDGGNWTLIMDEAAATVLAGDLAITGDIEVRDFCADREVAGRITVLAQGENLFKPAFIMVSNAHGDAGTWTASEIAGDRRYGVNGIQTYALKRACGQSNSSLNGFLVLHDISGSLLAWDGTDRIGFSTNGNLQCAIHRRVQDYYFFEAYDDGRMWMAHVQDDPIGDIEVPEWVLTEGQVGDRIPFERQDKLWFPPTTNDLRYLWQGEWDDEDTIVTRIIQNNNLFDIWISGSVITPFVGIYNINSLCWKVADEKPTWIIYGSSGYDALLSNDDFWPTAHVILVADADVDIVDVLGKAGDNCATAPYTDSIPRISGGPCQDGIQVVEFGQSE